MTGKPEDTDSPVAYLRLDSTGAMQVCGKLDSGARRYLREDAVADMVTEAIMKLRVCHSDAWEGK